MRTPENYQVYPRKKVQLMLIATFIIMGIGSVSELSLLGHYEDSWQLLPLVLITLSLLVFVLTQWKPSTTLLAVFKGCMLACISSGLLGTWFHLRANMDFESELHPTSSGGTFLWDSLSGALPTLAPGSMIVFGLIGFLYSLLIIKQSK